MLEHTCGRCVMQIWILSKWERLRWLELLLLDLFKDHVGCTLLVDLEGWVSELHATSGECQAVVLTFVRD